MPPASGGGDGTGDPKGRGKALVKCQQAIAKAGGAFVDAKLKALHACLLAVQQCLQVKFQEQAGCLAAAQPKCTAANGKVVAAETKLQDVIAKACDPVTPATDLSALTGLGYDAEEADCAVGPLTSVAAVTQCLLARHECRAEEILSRHVPRVRELLQFGGLDPNAFPCLETGIQGGMNGLGDAKRGGGLVKCQKSIAKAAATFLKNGQKAEQKCLGAVFKCVQLKPGDDKCLASAAKGCNKRPALLGPGSLGAKLQAVVEKACGAPRGVDPTDLLDEAGLGFQVASDLCLPLGVPAVQNASQLGDCLRLHHACRVGKLVEAELPRALELGILGSSP